MTQATVYQQTVDCCSESFELSLVQAVYLTMCGKWCWHWHWRRGIVLWDTGELSAMSCHWLIVESQLHVSAEQSTWSC